MSEDTWSVRVQVDCMSDVKDVNNLEALMSRDHASGNKLARRNTMLALSDIQMGTQPSDSQGTSSDAASTIIDGMPKSSDVAEAVATPNTRTHHGDTARAPASTTECGALTAADEEECGDTATAPALTIEDGTLTTADKKECGNTAMAPASTTEDVAATTAPTRSAAASAPRPA